MMKSKLVFLVAMLFVVNAMAQPRVGMGSGPKKSDKVLDLDYGNPKDYVIGEIKVSGIKFLDPNTLISVSGLSVGDKISLPGDKIPAAVRRLMDQGIIEDIEVAVTEVSADGKIVLEYILKERPRLNKYIFKGVRKGEEETLTDKIKLNKGKVITDAMIKNVQLSIKRHYVEKGFSQAKVQITQVPDSLRPNNAAMQIAIEKGKRIKIEELAFEGVEKMPLWKVRFKMKKTKEKNFARFYAPSKFIEKKYDEDKQKLIEWYNKKGYRDANIVADTVKDLNGEGLKVTLKISEGPQYYYRNITWNGNFIHTNAELEQRLVVKKGDVYNPTELQKRISGIPQGDVESLYMDDGYLYFRCEPVEISVDGDSIDVEMRINEGKQFTISKIVFNGNTKTSDHVALREIETLPGQKFNKTALIRTQRSLSNLGYFDPEKIGINPVPQNDGTVNIEYTVEEKASDNFQLSGGWSGFQGFTGTLGVTFNNFSAKNITKLKSYRPLPSGDGQKLGINFQSSGRYFQTYSLSFTEPWLGGKKPTNFGVSFYHTVQDTRGYSERLKKLYGDNPYGGYDPYGYGGYGGGLGGLGGGYGGYGYGLGAGSLGLGSAASEGYFKNTGATISLGKRLRWPDQDFSLTGALQLQRYDVFNSPLIANFDKGVSNDISLTSTLSRSNISDPSYPRTGSQFSLNAVASPPYSLISGKIPTNQYKLLESYKFMFDGTWYTTLTGKLVLKSTAHMGYLGRYNKNMDYSPFGRFSLGGAGLTMGSWNIGQELIGLRGYEDKAVYVPTNSEIDKLRTQETSLSRLGGIAYNKYAVELRYPVTLNPTATVYLLTFLEAGNSWGSYKDFNMFKLRRTAGVGARVLMPAFGLIGIDFGKAFDPIDGIPGIQNRGVKALTFTIGQQIR